MRMIDEIDWASLEHAYGRATDTAAISKRFYRAVGPRRKQARNSSPGGLVQSKPRLSWLTAGS